MCAENDLKSMAQGFSHSNFNSRQKNMVFRQPFSTIGINNFRSLKKEQRQLLKTIHMAIKLSRLLVILSLVLISGCYPNGAEFIDDIDLVYTNYSNQFGFSSKQTYAIPDSVIKITGDIFNDPDGDHKPSFLSASSAAVILDRINQNMLDYGWQRVSKNANPDVILLVSSVTTTNIYYYYDWWYWGWYYPGFYPGWGWYYPGYYPPYVTGYRSGSVLIQMVDAKAVAAGVESVPVVWTCILNGLAEGGTSSIAPRVQTGIDKAFAQSPYLKH